MKRWLVRIYTLSVFVNLGRGLFAMSKVAALEPLALRLARGFAWLVQFAHGVRPQTDAAALAEEWNRLMPSPKARFPIVHTEGQTAFVEIHIECPLRGSGNAEACWRSMEFDRALMKRVRGRLVVLESQSVTGGDCCRLAIRPEGANMQDLTVAHPRWHG